MIVASLGSDLARAHAEDVRESLASRYPGEVELHPLVVDDLLGSVLAGKADVAVHRMEHLDAGIPEDLTLAALLPRRSFTDALVADAPLRSLPRQARIGTSNVRRRALLLRARPDLQVLETHADVRSRIQQWRVGEWDGVVLPTISLKRLDLDAPFEELDPSTFVPSAGQGAIGCVCKRGSPFEAFLEGIDDARTRTEVEIERSVLHALGARPGAPVGVHAAKRGDRVVVNAVVVSLDGRRAVTLKHDLSAKDALYEADEFAERLRRMGGDVLLEQARKALG